MNAKGIPRFLFPKCNKYRCTRLKLTFSKEIENLDVPMKNRKYIIYRHRSNVVLIIFTLIG